MVVYSNTLSNNLILVNRMIDYFKSNEDKRIILKDILLDTNVSYSRSKVILTFLIHNHIIIKRTVNGNIVKYYYNKEMENLSI